MKIRDKSMLVIVLFFTRVSASANVPSSPTALNETSSSCSVVVEGSAALAASKPVAVTALTWMSSTRSAVQRASAHAPKSPMRFSPRRNTSSTQFLRREWPSAMAPSLAMWLSEQIKAKTIINQQIINNTMQVENNQ